ncbi:CDT1-like protein a, chloroplastic [Neltuma alba]|uniref:CDT1-like protein a, chloroplastic n=1 Tax=Neltuma alba TaxID=207710 RepID=UPI0010A2B25C|nr:CDT1-like protein a, chloroplastic [Prosopis alba]
MSSSEAKSLPFKSKKPHICHSASKSQSPDPISLSSKTPEKASQLSHRTRNRGVALSIREVRKVAESLQDQKGQRQNHDRTGQIKSARRKIAPSFAEISPRKSKASVDEPVKMPEKYEILGQFFDSLDSSIRLLHLKGSTTTFTNICPKIECLTDRRFTHSHLAQLKYIFPEALAIKKVLRFDERTSCMKPDLHLTLNPDSKLFSEGGNVSLRKLFRTRLRDFYESHPEVDEIPEEMLPEPFNHRKQDRPLETLRTTSSSFDTMPSNDAVAPRRAAEPESMQHNAMVINSEPAKGEENLSMPVNMSNEAHHQQPAVATHMSHSFRRRFSQKSVKDEADGVQQKSPSDSLPPQSVLVSESSMKKNSSSVDATMCPAICASPANLKSSGASAATPNKVASTPSRLMTHTPSLPPPKRCYMSPDDSPCSSPNKLVRRPTSLKKSLNFDTPVKNRRTENEADDAGGLSIDDDIYDILPEGLLQSIKEKERVAMEERNPAISQAKRRKKMIACLPKLFNMIHLLIHSLNRSVVTKEELLSKIISNHCDIVDRREVEEQLNLLLELVPEWISEKLASSGDLLFCINKLQDPETIRSRLAEAK